MSDRIIWIYKALNQMSTCR